MANAIDTDSAGRRRFIRHYLEMVIAMFAGMAIFGGLVSFLCAVSGHSALFDHAGASAPIMATNMVVGMSLWMRYRGHGWLATGEMAMAMYIPLVVLLIPFWLGFLPGGGLLAGMHVLMLPAMWLGMDRRRAEYSGDHQHLAPALAQNR
jgi:hypothetical protein